MSGLTRGLTRGRAGARRAAGWLAALPGVRHATAPRGRRPAPAADRDPDPDRTADVAALAAPGPQRWVCRQVQAALPRCRDGALRGWRARAVAAHLTGCPDCRAEEALHRGLAAWAQQGAADVQPPTDLLDQLLRTAPAGWRGRLAVPARGAVSGARPALTVALLAAAAGAGTGLGVGGARAVRAARRQLHRR